MKILHKINILALIALALCINSCKEIGPQIDLTNGKHNTLLDTTYVESPAQAPQPKTVLIEMFTGVSCINCPGAHVVMDNIITANPRRVIGVAMHSTAEPASQDEQLIDSREPLGCPDAQTIITSFGDLGARPIGTVNRISHTSAVGPVSVYDIAANWGGYTNTSLAVPSPVNIVLTKTYVDATHTLTVDVELHYTAAQTDSDKLTIFLTQDSIVTAQLQSDNSDDSTYVHNAVLRAAVTNALGDKVNANLGVGTVVKKIYTYTISNPLWKPEHMNIIAFVHKYQNGSSEVLQSATITVK
ncbi:MAG: hypothetical protein JWO03_150 [Bacteroidetes bacterium]|nr:hypothetical protein [Bacteroidota bacterium]